MKTKYLKIIIPIIYILIAVTACYEDDSTLDVNDIASVYIDTTGMSTLSVFQFENLQVNPEVELNYLSESDLSYSWKVNETPNDTNFMVIGNEKALNYEIRLKPNEGDYYYLLVCTVNNKVNDLSCIMSWPLYVRNNFAEGLAVAESDDNQNTDLSLILSPEVTPDYANDKVLRHVYSANNEGELISGLVKQMEFTNIYGSDVLLAITDNSLYRVNTFDFTFGGMNDDLFYAAKNVYQPQALGAIYQGDFYIGNNELTGTYLGVSNKFGLPFDFTFKVPGQVAMNPQSNPTIAVNFFDESIHGFVYLPSIQSFSDHSMHAIPAKSGDLFDPANIPGKVNVAAGTNIDGNFLHLLKDETSGIFSLYVLDGGSYEYPNYYPPQPRALYDLSSAPEIDDAKYFVFLDNQRVMYYATDTKIYAMIYSSQTPQFEERYAVSEDEKITTLQIYQQAGYPLQSSYIPTNNKQLVMSTYSDQGKVYFLPIINVGVGNIDKEHIKSFSGFGRISALIPKK